MVWAADFTPAQCELLRNAQIVFLTMWPVSYSLYYVSPINSWCGGDGKKAKFPCTMSWMTRKGLSRYGFIAVNFYGCALVTYGCGWYKVFHGEEMGHAD